MEEEEDMDEDECDVHYDELLEIECCTTTRIELKKRNSEKGKMTTQRGKRWTSITRV